MRGSAREVEEDLRQRAGAAGFRRETPRRPARDESPVDEETDFGRDFLGERELMGREEDGGARRRVGLEAFRQAALGEGIEKEQSDFAAEVAAQLGR